MKKIICVLFLVMVFSGHTQGQAFNSAKCNEGVSGGTYYSYLATYAGTTAVSFSMTFTGIGCESTTDGAAYVICPGCSMDFSGINRYTIYCENSAYSKRPGIFGWVYDINDNKIAQRSNGPVFKVTTHQRSDIIGEDSSTLAANLVRGTVPCGNSYEPASSFSLCRFNSTSPNRWNVYMDFLHAFCFDYADITSCTEVDPFACPYLGGSWRSEICRVGTVGDTVPEAEGWVNQREYEVIVPVKGVSIAKPSDKTINAGETTSLTWTITNTGIGKGSIRVSLWPLDLCNGADGWACAFVGYTTNKEVILNQGDPYDIVLSVTANGTAGSKTHGIMVTYDDGYSLTCITSSSASSSAVINVLAAPTTTTTSSTTTTTTTTMTTTTTSSTTTTTTTTSSTTTTTTTSTTTTSSTTLTCPINNISLQVPPAVLNPRTEYVALNWNITNTGARNLSVNMSHNCDGPPTAWSCEFINYTVGTYVQINTTPADGNVYNAYLNVTPIPATIYKRLGIMITYDDIDPGYACSPAQNQSNTSLFEYHYMT